MAPGGQVLGIDFGTSNTAAAIRWPDGRRRPLVLEGGPLLPSAVLLDDRGVLLTGREAVHSARSRPECFEPNPKRRVDDGSVLLGDRSVPVVDLISAVLRRVADEAERVAPGPVRLVLTHPAAWGPQRRAVLTTAAQRAGLPSPDLVPEPVAAASYFVDVQGARLPVGAIAVVYDFGAGTFDATVVRRTPAGFDVLASEGLPDAGGLDVDAAIVAYLGTVYAPRYPDQWARLANPRTTGDRRARRLLWEDARAAKETLSRSSSTLLPIPLLDEDAPLGREQLERLARPILDQTVATTARAIRSAGVAPGEVTGLFLVGGSSRIPLAATLLHTVLGIAPIAIEQPELVVAEGSITAAANATGQPVPSPSMPSPSMPSPPYPAAPVSGTPSSGYPVSPPTAGTPGSGYPVFGPPVSAPPAYPVSGLSEPVAPVSGSPVSGYPVSGPPVSGPPVSGPPVSGPPVPVSPARGSASVPPPVSDNYAMSGPAGSAIGPGGAVAPGSAIGPGAVPGQAGALLDHSEWPRIGIATAAIIVLFLISMTAEDGVEAFQLGLAALVAYPALFLLPAQVPVLMLSLTAQPRGLWRAIRYGLLYTACYGIGIGSGFLPYAGGITGDELATLQKDLATGGALGLGVLGLILIVKPWSGWPAKVLLPVLMGAGTGLAGLGAPWEWTAQAFYLSFQGGGGDPGDFGRFVAFSLGAGTMVLVAALLATLFAKAASAPDTRVKLARIGTLLLAGGASILVLVIMFA